VKKIFLVIGISALIFLTGCGWLFGLKNWTVPGVLEFAELAESLNTPQKISAYMCQNFTYEEHKELVSPYTLWKTKKGDCNDFATFGMFMAHYNGIKAYIIIIAYGKGYEHALAAYVEIEGMSFTDNTAYCNNWDSYFNSFKEIVDWSSDKWTKYKVYDWDSMREIGLK